MAGFKRGACEHPSGAQRERIPVGIHKLGAHHFRDGQAAALRPLLDGLAQGFGCGGNLLA
jgi:hypothetical protein